MIPRRLIFGFLGLAVAVQVHAAAAEDVRAFHEWEILDGKTGESMAIADWMAGLAAHDVIYIGEEHRNRWHVEAALKILRAMTEKGRRPALAMEMFGWDGQSALESYVSSETADRGAFLKDSRWEQNWGGPFEDYEPLVQFAREHRLALLALNPPKPLVRKVAVEGLSAARHDDAMRRWGVEEADLVEDRTYHDIIRGQLLRCHGGMSEDGYERMYQASLFRDEGMAKTLAGYLARPERTPPSGPVISYTGGGHIQYDVPIPKRVRRRSHDVKQVSIYLTALSGDQQRDEVVDLVRSGIADYIWLTPVGAHGPAKRCK
jgi:uncharacterized iron-regulated protein